MSSFQESLQNAIRGSFCSYIGTLDGFLTWLFEDDPIPTTPPPLVWARFMRRYFCNQEPPPFTSPPFEGGQCVGVSYFVDILADIRVDGESVRGYPFVFTVRGNGPIGGLYLEYVAVNQTSLRIQWGSPQPVIGNTVSEDEYYADYRILDIRREDGQPDNCGNLTDSPETPTPSPIIFLPVPYEDNNGNNFNIPLNIIFAPVRVDIDGSLNIPFRLQIDPNFELNINGTLNLNTGGINFNFGNPNLPPKGFPKQDDYDSPDDIPDYPPDIPNSISPVPPEPEEDETTEIIRAVIVTVTNYASNATVIDQADNPDIYAPNLGFVQFAISVNNAIAWTSDIPVKNFRNFIVCPWEGGAIKVRGTPRTGVTWTLTPVRLRIEEPIIFG